MYVKHLEGLLVHLVYVLADIFIKAPTYVNCHCS